MLINLLGGDGCGKTTQIARLASWVRETFGVPVRTLSKRDLFDAARFPASAFFGCTYETLAHDLIPRMRDESRALWVMYMVAALIQEEPPRADEVVFVDGYWQKHYATEAALGLSPEWLLDLCRFFPEPDLTILLDLDPRTIVARGRRHHPYESGCDFTTRDESFIAHQTRVRILLRDLAERRGYAVVAADGNEEMVFRELAERVQGSVFGALRATM